ncbi:Protein NUCLEAR FUSION DEFECTIVE 6 chloroplastic/mitochondrial-like [Quillaja saponaria]|uniref:Protein NUCLEAR FUSION DEFECTIVE 6 chloroplastic/mitochondrial-like n=1 Tax=Quillaja saponaria TaxID=32244 RepID=A0AAD7M424_QUISA|nr:Protein NUCLEAR FUSION DEFECTIVE 6 chloroplastic/mitochondrial-like [Quillaja saponaria]
MASSKVISRLSSQLQPLALKLSKQSLSLELSTLKSTSQSQVSVSARRFSRNSRLPLELSSLGSTMPLHSAVASARLVSSLPIESHGWGLVPQGISMPL